MELGRSQSLDVSGWYTEENRTKRSLDIPLSTACFPVGKKDYDPQLHVSDFPIYFRSTISYSLMFEEVCFVSFQQAEPSFVAL